MVSVDSRSHSFRRVLRITDTHLKAWCRICEGDTSRSRSRARGFDSQVAVMAWWRKHEDDPAHIKRTQPKALRKRREGLAEMEEQVAKLRAFGL